MARGDIPNRKKMIPDPRYFRIRAAKPACGDRSAAKLCGDGKMALLSTLFPRKVLE